MIEHVQTKMLNIGNYGCLCFCYLYMLGIDPEQFLFHYADLVEKKIIEKDCYVNDGNAFLKYFGSDKKVKFVSSSDKMYDRYIARFNYLAEGHFVVVDKNDRVIYNSLEDSICVNRGRLVEKRTLV